MDERTPRVVAVVIPTNRPEKFIDFFNNWEELFRKHKVHLVVVEDSPVRSKEISDRLRFFDNFTHMKWDLTLDFIPTKTGSIRSLGFLEAYRQGFEYIITLDDDEHPVDDPIEAFLDGFAQERPVSEYFDIGHSFGLGQYMRGFPLTERHLSTPVLQYGGWDNVPDLDALTQMQHENAGDEWGYRFDRRDITLPLGTAFTGCIMNVAIRREAIPMMYQLMMGIERVGFDRSDDIWSGLFAKKICDHLKKPIVINGNSVVLHTRASNTMNNLEKELLAYGYNEQLWERLKTIELSGKTYIECYKELSEKIDPDWLGPKGQVILDGMKKWITCFE